VRAAVVGFALAAVLARGAAAQDARNLLRLGGQAYDFAEYRMAAPLLVVGLNPAAGPRDSLWVASLHRLVHVLIEDRKDSVAAVWARWAVRTQPGLVVDTLAFPPAVQEAFALARAHVASAGAGDTLTETSWEWARRPGEPAQGALRIERSGVPMSSFVEGVGPLAGEDSQPLAPGTYTIVTSAPGYFRTRVKREVLPGVTTVLRFRLRGLPSQALGFLYLGSVPWGSVELDGERIGYTPVAAGPVAAGTHRVRIERVGYAPFDTVVTVERDQRLRLGTIRLRTAGAPLAARPAPLPPTAPQSGGGETLARGVAALEATETERAVELLRQLVATFPPPPALSALRRDAQLQLGVASWSLGLFDSASVHFQRALIADAFTRLDPETFNPDLRAFFRAAKRATFAIGVRTPADTALVPATERWPVSVAVTRPGTLRFRLAGPGGYDTVVASSAIDSTATVALALVGRDSVALAAGAYRLTVEWSDALGSAAAPPLALDVSEQPADTLLHEAAPSDSLYRLEVRLGPPSRASLARGLGFGVGAGVIPVLFANSRLRGVERRAVTVGVAVSLAGAAGYFLGRTRRPLPENIAYNRALRSDWEARNRAIAAANERRRGVLLVRVRVVSPP
jgi:hypothetical protein